MNGKKTLTSLQDLRLLSLLIPVHLKVKYIYSTAGGTKIVKPMLEIRFRSLSRRRSAG